MGAISEYRRAAKHTPLDPERARIIGRARQEAQERLYAHIIKDPLCNQKLGDFLRNGRLEDIADDVDKYEPCQHLPPLVRALVDEVTGAKASWWFYQGILRIIAESKLQQTPQGENPLHLWQEPEFLSLSSIEMDLKKVEDCAGQLQRGNLLLVSYTASHHRLKVYQSEQELEEVRIDEGALISAAGEGLVQASFTYDPTRFFDEQTGIPIRFSSYAGSSMSDKIRREIKREVCKQLGVARKDVQIIREKKGVWVQVDALSRKIDVVPPHTFDQMITKEEERDFEPWEAGPYLHDLFRKATQWGTLSYTQRESLKARYGVGERKCTLEEVGKLFRISRQGASFREEEALNALRSALRPDAVGLEALFGSNDFLVVEVDADSDAGNSRGPVADLAESFTTDLLEMLRRNRKQP